MHREEIKGKNGPKMKQKHISVYLNSPYKVEGGIVTYEGDLAVAARASFYTDMV
ncbi:hypothetical protein Psch_00593 [Pelotomaculum schinkii]|uniref:Uncharacterized protein n=1 Tax=Pelotomaculum schinkii TaxID=78350 RepID=A0A4Y7REC2_9FIRM|nr:MULTISPECIES: hypothetical protein [Pelotomaculum]TEB07052.1 hypothetical protein Psch_00593 [Pelotomaculum schinkii]TEB16967.1 hypothetical protein Psfp_00903 [Pelotomaculum sp. FP]